jgi:hypothetical protein
MVFTKDSISISKTQEVIGGEIPVASIIIHNDVNAPSNSFIQIGKNYLTTIKENKFSIEELYGNKQLQLGVTNVGFGAFLDIVDSHFEVTKDGLYLEKAYEVAAEPC